MPKIEFLDHVAIKVADPQKSATWYCELLGLSKFQPEEWKPVPIMVLAGNSGLAIFRDEDNSVSLEAKSAFHFAFRSSLDGIEEIVLRLESRGIAFERQDHTYFQSVYFRDPDMYRVEVTAPVK